MQQPANGARLGSQRNDAYETAIAAARISSGRHMSCSEIELEVARNMDWKTDHLHGHQTDNVLVITLASFADRSCVSSSSSTIRSSPALVMPSGRQIRAVLGT